MKSLIIWIVVLVALAGGGWWAWKNHPDKIAFWKSSAPAPKKSSRPTTAEVTPRNISFAIYAAGDLGPADQVSVRPEVSGKIATLLVDINDPVKKDQVLFTLDDQDLKTELSSRLTEIDAAKLQIEGSRLQVEKIQANFDRTKQLFDGKLVSKEVFDNIKSELDLAKNSHDLANNSLERAKKTLQQVEDKLAKTKILAPFDCTVLTRPVSVGQAVSGSGGVNAGTEVLTIANLTLMVITAHINQADVTRLQVNQVVEVEVEAVPGLKLLGNVDRIAPQATIRNGIKGFTTRILLKNAQTQVRPGMTANLTIPLAAADNVIAVPLAAVFTDQGERFVYVKNGEKFSHQPVQLGVTDYDFAEVTKGLSGGEIVSLVQPADEVGKGSQAFQSKAGPGGTKAAGGKGGGKGGKGKGGKGGGPPGEESGKSAGKPPASN